jgi:hypothetical protein
MQAKGWISGGGEGRGSSEEGVKGRGGGTNIQMLIAGCGDGRGAVGSEGSLGSLCPEGQTLYLQALICKGWPKPFPPAV